MIYKLLVAQLANRINQPHVIETYMHKVFAAGVEEGKEEVKLRATEAFRLFISRYCAESGRKDISEDSEHYVKVFNELINS
ncbi:hypothetical protein [Bacteroides thetaiotaomicron]|uniref:hypothetical protein n=1 Tax=Bacteroides thetaiotaomicron TaxID=818 RepID=UPI0032C05400